MSTTPTPDPNATKDIAVLRAEAEAAATNLERLEEEYDALLADPGVIQEDRDTHRMVVERARAAEKAARDALERHETGSYGLCQSCGQPIPPARLEAIPNAVRCVSCEARS